MPVTSTRARRGRPPVREKGKLTSADSQERRVNGARESVPSPDDEAEHHEDQDDGPRHGHHRDDDDRVLLAGDDGGCRDKGQTHKKIFRINKKRRSIKPEGRELILAKGIMEIDKPLHHFPQLPTNPL